MANEQEAKSDETSELALLQKAIKTNRTLVFALLIFAFIIFSVLITSVFVINSQFANRREVSSEEFSELLAELNDQLAHVVAIHNSEAQVYFGFQDSLDDIKTQYQHENINNLRDLLIAQEKEKRKLMEIMVEGNKNLANMFSGSRSWTQAFAKNIDAENKRSLSLEKQLVESKNSDNPVDKSLSSIKKD